MYTPTDSLLRRNRIISEFVEPIRADSHRAGFPCKSIKNVPSDFIDDDWFDSTQNVLFEATRITSISLDYWFNIEICCNSLIYYYRSDVTKCTRKMFFSRSSYIRYWCLFFIFLWGNNVYILFVNVYRTMSMLTTFIHLLNSEKVNIKIESTLWLTYTTSTLH